MDFHSVNSFCVPRGVRAQIFWWARIFYTAAEMTYPISPASCCSFFSNIHFPSSKIVILFSGFVSSVGDVLCFFPIHFWPYPFLAKLIPLPIALFLFVPCRRFLLQHLFRANWIVQMPCAKLNIMLHLNGDFKINLTVT